MSLLLTTMNSVILKLMFRILLTKDCVQSVSRRCLKFLEVRLYTQPLRICLLKTFLDLPTTVSAFLSIYKTRQVKMNVFQAYF